MTPPLPTSFSSIICKDKERGGGLHPIVLLVFHQFTSNRSSMKRFKGPVTTLLSPISTPTPTPRLISHIVTTKHTHTHTQVSSAFHSRPPRFLCHPPVKPTDSMPPPRSNLQPRRLATVQEVLNSLLTVMSDRKVKKKGAPHLIRLAGWGVGGGGCGGQPGTRSYLSPQHMNP